ncbi:hypothetical protein V8G54_035124, partial [Vigna mungo]
PQPPPPLHPTPPPPHSSSFPQPSSFPREPALLEPTGLPVSRRGSDRPGPHSTPSPSPYSPPPRTNSPSPRRTPREAATPQTEPHPVRRRPRTPLHRPASLTVSRAQQLPPATMLYRTWRR